MNPLLNFLAFQVGWFSCVLGAANGFPWLGPAVTLIVVLLHLVAVTQPRPEFALMVLALFLGSVLDSTLMASGWLRYEAGLWVPGVAPYWIISMWVLFATTLNVSMRWMRGKYWLAALFGAVGGPLSYLAGARLGAVVFVDLAAALVALTFVWAFAMPVLMWLATKHDGTVTNKTGASTNGWVVG